MSTDEAALHAAERDGATSSAMFGAVAAALLLVAPLVILHRLLEFQHLSAAAIGTACWWTWTHRDLKVDAPSDS